MTVQELIESGIPGKWLSRELYRRAAFHFEKCGELHEAAECRVKAHEFNHAVEIYLKLDDHARAAPLLLSEKRYPEALNCFQRWMDEISEETQEKQVSAMLGISACLKMMKIDLQAARDMYCKARKIIEREDKDDDHGHSSSLASGRCWEALGIYGRALDRYDLVQAGYEKSLACFGEEHNQERLKTAVTYLELIQKNRLLAADLENRIAEWSLPEDDDIVPEPPLVPLRSEAITVSDDESSEVFNIAPKYPRRPLEYVKNEFEVLGEIVLDHTTGIMWQKSDSKNEMPYEEANAYVKKLNQDHFAEYEDWRLPTVDELASLLEPEKNSENNLYIDPIFDCAEGWYWNWTSDKRVGGGAWGVHFNDGSVGWSSLNYSSYVRVCRA
ncbi:DUF1566 domain-containing protein [Desulfobacterales bacterium HSG16]|nr:DUF1566 domain-containing protein [Desulfobacterales bacterium HSG16]